MRQKTCAFTGHRTRDLKREKAEAAKAAAVAVAEAYRDGCRRFVFGMAEGCDEMFFYAALNLQRAHPKIKLVAAMPYRGAYGDRYTALCDEVHYSFDDYTPECFHVRDRWMVNEADVVAGIYDGNAAGGTTYTLRMAQLANKPIRLY